MGQEYIRSHRAYRELAARLSKVGFPVLRFDFYGCGDSGGDCEQGEIRQWVADISMAIDEIRGRSGFVPVCLVGLRLGGTLAAMAGAERGDVDAMVLWDPVVSGKAYIEELRTLHQEMLRYSRARPKRRMTGEKYTEILGFPLTAFMRRDLEKVDLLAIRQKPAHNLVLIESNREAAAGRFKEHLTSIGAHIEYQHLPGPKVWVKQKHAYGALVPQQLLHAAISWIAKVYP